MIDPIKQSRSLNLVEHAKIAGKPQLQQVGGKLDTLTLEVTLSPALVNVEGTLSNLRELLDGQEKELYIGDEYEGEWVIENLEENPFNLLQNDGEWTITHIELKINLKEYVPLSEDATSELARAILGGFPVFG